MRKLITNIPVIITALLMIAAVTSCEDYLTVAPENDLIKEKFWTKREDVYSALGATYDALREASLQSLIFGEVRADLVKFTGGSFADYAKIGASNISPTNGKVNWKAYYTAINLANTLMFYDKEVAQKDKTFTKEMMDAVDAEWENDSPLNNIKRKQFLPVFLIDRHNIFSRGSVYFNQHTEYPCQVYLLRVLLQIQCPVYVVLPSDMR